MAFFSFNGVTKDYVRVLRGLERPAWAPIEHEILEIPGRPGGLISGKKIKVRQINIPVRIYTKTFESLQKVKEDLAAWLITDEPKELIFTDEPDRVYYAQVTGELNLDELVEWGEGVISFLCPDPYKYGPLRTQTIAVPPASFSRNSVAYLSDGTQVAANQPRFEQGGILIEEGTVNLVSNPSFEGGVWSELWNPTDGTVSLVPGWNGIGSAVRIEITKENTKFGIISNRNMTLSEGATYTISFRARAIRSNFPITYMYLMSNTVGNTPLPNINVGTTWQRYTITYTIPTGKTASNYGLMIAIDSTRSDVYANDWVEIDDVQLEQKPYATSFVDGTRAAETLTLPTDGVLNPEEGTIEAWVYVPDTSFNRAIVVLDARDSTRANRLFIELYSKTPRAVIQKGAAYIATGNNPLSPGWHFVAATWSFNRLTCYADGVLVAQYTNPMLLDSFSSAAIGSTIVGEYQFNSLIGPLRLSRIARSDAEIMEAYQNGFTVDEYTTAYLPFDGDLNVQTPNIVVNEGTAETYPVFTSYVKQPITFLDIIAPDAYMRVGQPYTVSQTPTDGDKPVMIDEMTTTTGWGAGSSVVGGIVQGTMVSDGNRFVVQSFGPTFNGWGGPALKKSLPYQLQDFRVHALIDIKSSANGTGRIEVYGLDTANNIVFRMSIGDFSAKSKDVKAFWELGPNTDSIFTTYGKKTGSLNDYYGSLAIERRGNRWKVYTARRTGPTNKPGVYVDYVEKTFIDTKNQYTAPLAQIQVHIGTHLGYGAINHMSINHVFVYDLYKPATNQVPYIAYPDDVLQFDHKNAVVYRNGEPIMSVKDFGARFFPLGPGATEFAVNPSDAAIVEVEYRPRYK